MCFNDWMSHQPESRIPVVAGLAYREAVSRLSERFTVTLAPDTSRPYNPSAVVVAAGGVRIGYLAPEVARHVVQEIVERGRAGTPVEAPARRETGAGRTFLGILVSVDLSGLGIRTTAEPGA
jgi:hypothetical protein